MNIKIDNVPPEILEKLERRRAARERLRKAADKVAELTAKIEADKDFGPILENVKNNIN